MPPKQQKSQKALEQPSSKPSIEPQAPHRRPRTRSTPASPLASPMKDKRVSKKKVKFEDQLKQATIQAKATKKTQAKATKLAKAEAAAAKRNKAEAAKTTKLAKKEATSAAKASKTAKTVKIKEPNSRLAPPNPIRLTWDPSNVQRRVIMNQAYRHRQTLMFEALLFDSETGAFVQDHEEKNSFIDDLILNDLNDQINENTLESEQKIDVSISNENQMLNSNNTNSHDETSEENLEQAIKVQKKNNMKQWQKNYIYRLRAQLKIRSHRAFWYSWMRKIDDDWYKDDYYAIHTLTYHIAIAQVKFDCFKFDVIQTYIQSDAKIKKQMITLNRLSRNEWRDAMNSILIDMWRIKFNYKINVDIKVENSYVAFEIVLFSTSLTRFIQVVDELINSFAKRKTRIVQQKKRATIVRDRNEQQENNIKLLFEK